MADSCDVAVIGGGIIGTSAAAYLAEAGRSVILFERSELAAGASGRNSGAIQHPFDPPIATLHRESLPLYRELAMLDPEFQLDAAPAGLLLVAFDHDEVEAAWQAIASRSPEVSAQFLPAGEASRLEPTLSPEVIACRLSTGYPLAPSVATLAFGRRAARAGVEIRIGEARPTFESGRVAGVALASGDRVSCEHVLVAAGPWTPTLVPGWADDPPIRPIWGVVVATTFVGAPRHVLEELGIDKGRQPDSAFSLVTASGMSSVGSTFLSEQPDPQSWAPKLMHRAADFVPALAKAEIRGVRACARPQSFDGRPIIGGVPGTGGLFVCAGHGAWGISTGPASASRISRQMLGDDAIAGETPEFSPARR